MRLLLIEDEEKIGLPLKVALERHKYAVDYIKDGESGYEEATNNCYDCIILDVNLPRMDGFTLAKTLRENLVQTPIIMLTARAEQEDVITGLENGADDYLRKPFQFKELLLRIHSLIKRNSTDKSMSLEYGNIKIDTYRKKVTINGSAISLNSKEYGVLEYLMHNCGRVVSQEELLEHVWDREIDFFTQTVRTNIKTLRKKVDPDKQYIKTIKGSGYIIDEI